MITEFRNGKRNHGFTLIEMLIVVALIIIIAGIALPRFLGVTGKGRQARAQAELKSLDTAITGYLTFNLTSGDLPTAQTTIAKVLGGTAEGSVPASDPFVVPNYNLPNYADPFVPTSTLYAYFVNKRFYVVTSVGPDGGADITGVSSAGKLTGTIDDDIFATNGTGTT
jgi:general secretion pathway protein G